MDRPGRASCNALREGCGELRCGRGWKKLGQLDYRAIVFLAADAIPLGHAERPISEAFINWAPSVAQLRSIPNDRTACRPEATVRPQLSIQV